MSSAYWPIIWPSPEPVKLTIFTGASQLLLPVRQPQSEDSRLKSLPEPASCTPSPLTIVRGGRLERSVSIDQITGRVNHRLYVDGGTFVPPEK